MPSRRRFLFSAALLLPGAATLAAWRSGAAPIPMRVVKSPSCGCCAAWVTYMEKNGFKVTVENMEDLTRLKRANGVTAELASCHTAFVGGYVIEGHVPADLVKKILVEKPAGMKGLAAPGMPSGAPGMDVDHARYTIYSFDAAGRAKSYSVR